MLMAVKNQIKVSLLTIKYSLMREMLNKATFLSNIVFMILNNATFLIQWVILFSIKENIGDYSIKHVILLWGIAASTYGFSRFFFHRAFSLSDIINQGKLDAYLVQPKNVLISAITSDVSTSALGDMIYGYIMLCIYGITLQNFILFTLFMICGGLILTSLTIIFSSLSFWFNKSDALAETIDNITTNFATYPEGIFKGAVRIVLLTIIPVEIVNYIPIRILTSFDFKLMLIVIGATLIYNAFAFIIFYRGLRKYSSTNLMIAKM